MTSTILSGILKTRESPGETALQTNTAIGEVHLKHRPFLPTHEPLKPGIDWKLPLNKSVSE